MEVVRLLAYDRWATKVVLEQCLELNDEQFLAEAAGALGSVRQQAVHLVSVSDRYRARILGEPVPDVAPESFASAREVLDYSTEVASRMEAMGGALTPEWLAKVVRHETRGGVFVLTVEQTLMHVVNHGTFHRGQIACLLKLHRVEPVNSDLVLWPGLQGGESRL